MPVTETQRTIARILKVNHAGEYGAIRIYTAQLWAAQLWLPDLVPFLTETLGHEVAHCQHFRDAMPARGARPCHAMPLWGVGGFALGLITALMGRNAVMACTRAVEATVHRHLDEQIAYLSGRDEALRTLIITIQVEEDSHLHHAEANLVPSPFMSALQSAIVAGTEAVIWMSTQGAVTRMLRTIRRSA